MTNTLAYCGTAINKDPKVLKCRSQVKEGVVIRLFPWRHNIRYNDAQLNDTKCRHIPTGLTDTWQIDTQHSNTQHSDVQHKNNKETLSITILCMKSSKMTVSIAPFVNKKLGIKTLYRIDNTEHNNNRQNDTQHNDSRHNDKQQNNQNFDVH